MKKSTFILVLIFLSLGAYSCSPDAIVSDENTTKATIDCCGEDGEIDLPPPDQDPK